MATVLGLLWLLGSCPALGAGSLLIWPLDPTIEAGQHSSAIWLENVGTQPLTLQIRVRAWSQHDHQDEYTPQHTLVGTPPFSTIAPGKKQFIRLTLTEPVARGQERAFRILIDELPAIVADGKLAAPTSAGLRFQMRYSLPLFAYGSGLRGNPARALERASTQAVPQLDWSIRELDGQSYLELRNTGSAHARLSQVRLLHSGSPASNPPSHGAELSSGLLGYVLPGAIMRWPLGRDLAPQAYHLQARLGHAAEPILIAPR